MAIRDRNPEIIKRFWNTVTPAPIKVASVTSKVRSKIHVGGQAVEALYSPGGQGCQPQSHPHHSRCCDQCGRGSPLVTRRRAQSANAYRRDDQPKSQPVKGGEKSGQVAE